MKRFFLLTTFILSVGSLIGQTVYENYQDGKLVFKLSKEQKIILGDENGEVEKNHPLIKNLIGSIPVVSVVQLHPEVNDDELNRTYEINLVDPNQIDELERYMSENKALSYVEKKVLHKKVLSPNDTYFDVNFQYSLFLIDAELAWDLSTGNSNVVVAVTDNAFDMDHPDLINKYVTGYDAADNDNDPSPCAAVDGYHGSHVAGIVGAETNNNEGVSSIGYNVSIMPIKIGNCSNGSLSGGYAGVIWAADNGADVINMSWGVSGSFSQYGQDACNYAWNEGSILVAAAGNDGVTTQFYPAAFNNVISVASTDQNDNKSSFSQYGTWIDIAAPGSQIASTDHLGAYQYESGTSMASPLVSGLLGLMKSYAPTATNQDLINCLYSGSDAITSYSGQMGAGRINAYNSLMCLTVLNNDYDCGITQINEPNGNICGTNFTPEIIIQNYGAITLTSATITYDYNGTAQTYSWTGNLAAGASETVTLPTQTGTNGTYTFTATTSNPNGNTDENTSNDSSASSFTIISSGQLVDFTLLTDCYGTETTWQITDDATNSIVSSGGPYTNATSTTTINESYCLADGCYTFSIDDSYGDGLNGSTEANCSIDGDYYATDASGSILFEMTTVNFGNGTTHNFCLQSGDLDASISAINNPTGSLCGNTIYPEVVLSNTGDITLTAVEINYSAGGAISNYNWIGSLVPGQTETVTLPSISTTAGNIQFIASTNTPNGSIDDNTSNDELQESIVVTNGPNVSASAVNSSICAGESTNIEASGATSYAWDNNVNTSSQTVSPTTSTTYTVIGTNANNCSNTATITINVNALPNTPTIIQNGNTLSVTLQAGETATWELNGGAIGTGSSITITQNGNYTVTITNANGCENSSTNTFNVDTSSLDANTITQLLMYPNPTKNIVTIKGDGLIADSKIVVIDASGRQINLQVNGNYTTGLVLNFENTQDGVYFIRVNTNQGIEILRLIVNQ